MVQKINLDEELNFLAKDTNVAELVRAIIAMKESAKFWQRLPSGLVDDTLIRFLIDKVFVNIWGRPCSAQERDLAELFFKRIANETNTEIVSDNGAGVY